MFDIEKEREETKALKKAIHDLFEECDLLSEEEKDEFQALFTRCLKLGAMREQLKLEGCVVVPVEPTQAMIDAVRSEHEGEPYLPYSLYKSFLKAALEEAARGGK